MAQLDALRAAAVLAVMVHHLAPALFPGLTFSAWAGVRLFFVLSGFLVTAQLLRARDAVDAGQTTLGAALRRFHGRRLLRIVPVYYAVILGLAWAGAGEVREHLWWHLAFLSNVRFVIDGWHHAYIGQFWFLAAQEQFYLVWPLLMLALPRRALLPVVLVTIAIGPLYRAWAVSMGWTLATEALLPANLDTLGLGALLALLTHRGSVDRFRTRGWAGVGTAAAALLLALQVAPVAAQVGPVALTAASDLLMGVASLVLIAHAAAGFGGAAGRVMTWPPLLYLGTISYGAFAYHLVAGGVVAWAIAAAGWAPLAPAPFAGWAVALTLAVSALSWHFVEQPLARFKGR
jgi:peptidoglycan/LPS O-acetylase OafA/YrhL